MSAESDAIRIAAELVDVLLHPTQSETLIVKPDIVHTPVFLQDMPVAPAQEAEDAEAVLDLDEDEGVVVGLHEHAGVGISVSMLEVARVWGFY